MKQAGVGEMKTDPYIVGVDVGGTFTDLFFVNRRTGETFIDKVQTTPENRAAGIVGGIEANLPEHQGSLTIVHGTTAGTNALLEKKGAKTGLITTQGCRDVLEMRRRDRPQTWGLKGTFEPVVARPFRLEVHERVLASGEVLQSVDPEEVQAAAKKLIQMGCESVCISFINSYKNPENERIAARAVREVWPNTFVSCGSGILPEIREFERTSTTALNAYLQPVVSRYLENLQEELARITNEDTPVFIIQSNGGSMTLGQAAEFPIRTALSGPAAGVTAAQKIAEEAGYKNVLTCDMGGTSFDVAMIVDGDVAQTVSSDVDFGMTIRSPMTEITTIGAGGGSIVSVDRSGLLSIGPESAGSIPGPACYDQGGERPTVTDVQLVLGRINPDRFLGDGKKSLSLIRAEAAIEKHIARPLGLSVVAAAEAALKVTNSKLAGALRLVSIERGHDPGKLVALPFGGGGSLHIGALIDEIGIEKALIPPYPGVASAIGCTIADMKHDFLFGVHEALDEMDSEIVKKRIETFVSEGEKRLAASSLEFAKQKVNIHCEMSYQGQTHGIAVGLDSRTPSNQIKTRLSQGFRQQYEEMFGRLLDSPIKLMAITVTVIGKQLPTSLTTKLPLGSPSPDHHRRMYCDGEMHEVAVWWREDLPVGFTKEGPLIVEQKDTTIVVESRQSMIVDEGGRIIISRNNPQL